MSDKLKIVSNGGLYQVQKKIEGLGWKPIMRLQEDGETVSWYPLSVAKNIKAALSSSSITTTTINSGH